MLSIKSWRVDALIRFFFLFFALMLFSSAFLLLWPGRAEEGGGGSEQLDFAGMVLTNAVFHGGMLLLIFDFIRRHQISWAEAFGFKRGSLSKHVGLAAVVVPLVIPISMILGVLSALLLESMSVEAQPQEVVRVIQETESGVQMAYFGVVAILIAPFVEEVLFRGILYPALKELGRPRLALWGTAVLFALSHENIMTLLPLTFLAVVLTWLYEKTDNLLTPIAAHALFNAVNFSFLIFQDRFIEIAPV